MTRIFDEKFEDTATPGYDESWTEAVGASCTIDENADPRDVAAANPVAWGSQCCKVIHAGGVANYAYSQIGDADVRYFRAEFVFTDLSSVDDNADYFQALMGTNNALGAPVFILYIYNLAGTICFYLDCYHDGSSNGFFSDNAVAEDTLYRFELEWDSSGNDNWEWKINGVSQDNGNLTATHADFGGVIIGGTTAAGVAGEFYLDLMAFDGADWVGVESSIVPLVIHHGRHT